MFILTGRIFTITVISDKAIQIVLKKSIRKKMTCIAVDLFGFWKEKADSLKLKKNDKIKGRVYIKSRLYKNKWYSDLYFREIEILDDNKKPNINTLPFGETGIEHKHIYDDKGNVLL